MSREGTVPFGDPDVQLVLRVRKGDDAAFEELVRRHQRNILNLVYRYLGDAAAAEDAAQEIFIKLHRSCRKYEPTARFSTWLYRVAVNHCLNVLRARKARPTVSEPTGEPFEPRSAEDPESQSDRRELQEAVRAAVQSLPPQQRLAVLLARFHELSYNEIGTAMGLSLEAVKSVMFRAKENLQRLLARYTDA